jgi:hypothetical protein
MVLTMKRSAREHSSRPILVGSLVFSCLFILFGGYESRSEYKQKIRDETADTLRVTIDADKAKVKSGETLTLYVRIYNQGTESVYVATDFDGPDNALSRLNISLFHDGSLIDKSQERSAADYSRYRPDDPKRPPLATEFSKYWLTLLPRRSYGGKLVLGPGTFPTLRTPGKYEIRGTYRSSGFMSSGMNNPLSGYVEELRQMPYQAWVGEVETNKVRVEVVGPTR